MILIKKMLVAVLILASMLFLVSCSEKYTSTDEKMYQKYISEVVGAADHMPKLTEIGKYESILITRKTPGDIFFFTTNTVALIVQYDAENFAIQCGAVDERYTFLQGPKDFMEDADAEALGYKFRVVDGPDFYQVYGGEDVAKFTINKSFIIGINEDECKIAYLCHWEHALDRIKDLDNFIKENYVLK